MQLWNQLAIVIYTYRDILVPSFDFEGEKNPAWSINLSPHDYIQLLPKPNKATADYELFFRIAINDKWNVHRD